MEAKFKFCEKKRRKIVICKLRKKHVQPQITQPKYTGVGVLSYAGLEIATDTVAFAT